LWGLKASVFWQIPPYERSAYKALYAAGGSDDFGQIVSTICTNGLRSMYEEKFEGTEAIAVNACMQDSDFICNRLYNRCGEELQEYGVDLKRVKVRSLAPKPAQVLKSGLMQMPGTIAPGTLGIVTEEGANLGIVA
jgi:hypothetical protein